MKKSFEMQKREQKNIVRFTGFITRNKLIYVAQMEEK